MFDDVVTIYCRKCSKPIDRVPYPGFRTVTSCAECDLQEKSDDQYRQYKAQQVVAENPIAAVLDDAEVEVMGNITLVKPKEKKTRRKKKEV